MAGQDRQARRAKTARAASAKKAKTGKAKTGKAKRRRQAATAQRYELYERSVMSPEADLRFARRVFKRHHGRVPTVLREDFCGTALLAASWVKARPENRALGVDLDPKPLDWGREHHLPALGRAAERLQLVQGDVREVRRPRAEVTLALNFSYFCFHERSELLAYLRSARASLAEEGVLILDCYGGTESMELLEEETDHGDFTYVWDQDRFDPVTHALRCYIHFRFPDGSELSRAFSYDWRLWSTPEIVDCLRDAGFQQPEVWWEGFDDEGEGDGRFRRVSRGEPCEGFIGYITARR